VIVRRGGETVAVAWTYPGLNAAELLRYAVSGLWLAYFFWLVGLLITMNLRPRGGHRAVAIAFSYLLAVGIMLGGDSRVWYGARLFLFVFWIGIPICLHFHWLWPRSLGRLPAPVVWAAYGIALVPAIAALFGRQSMSVFFAGLAIGLFGSLLLLIFHAVRQSEQRPGLSRLAIMGIIAMLPQAGYPFLSERLSGGMTELLTSVALPLLPIAYATAAYRRQLGDLEVRINRIATMYAILLLQGLVLLPVITLVALQWTGTAAVIVIGAFTGILGTIVGIVGYPSLQAFLERRTFGIPHPPTELLSHYAIRMTTSSSLPRLEALLKEEILPSLLIRQFAFLRIDQDRTSVLFAMGVPPSELPDAAALPELWKGEGAYREPPPSGDALPYPWIRVVMALGVEDDLVGVWLLGRRDPDDIYTAAELALIRSLANQTAIALSNIIQTERVRELYQANVTRTEEERLQLAHALHDRVLNQLAALLMRLDDPSITPAVLKSFEEFSNRVREIVADLRPPMLVYGLRPALAELVEALAERPPQDVSFSLDLPESETRYPPEVELHLFRIAQESCENAFRHAHAKKVTISGRLDPDRAEIHVTDDGAGFRMAGTEALGRLIAQKHFGLAGLIERANLIGGTVQIQTAPGKGTRIRARWKAGPTEDVP
jgi:signal transduction histidine kinase